MFKRVSLYVVVALALIGALALAGCSKSAGYDNAAQSQAQTQPQTSSDQNAQTAPQGQSAQTAPQDQSQPAAPKTSKDVTKLVIKDLKVGTGAKAVAGKNVTVHYTGWLTDGTKFDSSVDRGQPFQFALGAGQVIAGWDQGVAGMKVGGVRRLTIPPSLGYGAQGSGGVIPPNATLVFEVQLLSVN